MLRRSAARMSSGAPSVIVRSYPKATLITLNRESALNALNVEMVRSLRGVYVPIVERDPDSHLVVMRGAGHKAFCAGGDVVSIVKDDPKGCKKTFFYEEYQVNNTIATMRQTQISLWDGIVMGGGFGVSIHGRHRVATPKTLFAMPETGIGLFPDVGGTYVLPRLPMKGLGMYLALTGARLKGADVFHAGLATSFVSGDVSGLMHELLTSEDVSAARLDKVLADATQASGTIAPFSLQPHAALISEIFGADDATSAKAIMERLEQASGTNEFAKTTLAGMKKCSPLALEVTFALLRHGAKLTSVSSAFEMEYRASQRFMEAGEFDAGVTALLIEKTGKPKWAHATVADVPADLVRKFMTLPESSVEWHPSRAYPESKL